MGTVSKEIYLRYHSGQQEFVGERDITQKSEHGGRTWELSHTDMQGTTAVGRYQPREESAIV